MTTSSPNPAWPLPSNRENAGRQFALRAALDYALSPITMHACPGMVRTEDGILELADKFAAWLEKSKVETLSGTRPGAPEPQASFVRYPTYRARVDEDGRFCGLELCPGKTFRFGAQSGPMPQELPPLGAKITGLDDEAKYAWDLGAACWSAPDVEPVQFGDGTPMRDLQPTEPGVEAAATETGDPAIDAYIQSDNRIIAMVQRLEAIDIDAGLRGIAEMARRIAEIVAAANSVNRARRP